MAPDPEAAPRGHGGFPLRRALALAWRAAPGLAVVHVALTLVQGLLPLLPLWLAKLLTDAVVAAARSPDPSGEFPHVLLLTGLTAGAALLGMLLTSLLALVGETHARLVGDRMQAMLHAQSVAVDLDYYEDPAYQDTLHRAQAEAPFRPLKILLGLTDTARSLLSITAMAGLLATFHWSIALAVVLAAIPAVLVRRRHSGRLFTWQRRSTPAERGAAWFARVLTRPEFAKELRLFGLGSRFLRRFDTVRARLRGEQLQLSRRRTLAMAGAQLVSIGAQFGCHAYVAWRTVQGSISLGDMIMYVQAIQRGQSYVQGVFAGVSGLLEDRLFLVNLFEFLDLPVRIKAPADPVPTPTAPGSGLRFEGVFFRYPRASVDALAGIDLDIATGERVALVGRNGAGKSTVARLLCRLHDPTGGRISMDGHDLRAFDPHALRRLFAVVFQDFARYDLTAAENIELGDVAGDVTRERIVAAAERAGIHDLITSFPAGYETLLGNWFEGGRQLSLGQWQRIALARAFVRPAPVIILDEPSAGLDPEAEARLYDRFNELLGGRTSLLISHRLATARLADRVVLLDGGRIAEQGTHEELLRRGGSYARLFERQARHYRSEDS